MFGQVHNVNYLVQIWENATDVTGMQMMSKFIPPVQVLDECFLRSLTASALVHASQPGQAGGGTWHSKFVDAIETVDV